jgi:hypothetical protein
MTHPVEPWIMEKSLADINEYQDAITSGSQPTEVELTQDLC